MSAVIQGDALAGLPPPLLMGVTEASELAFLLQGDRTGPSVAQLIASRTGEGTSTLVRDLCLVAAANGSRTLLLAAEPPGRRTDWPRSIYGMPSGLHPTADGSLPLEMVRVGETGLALAAPTGPVPLQVTAWIAILARLREAFDFVVVDAPALDRAFTGIMLAPHVDAVALVVAAETTRASAARALRDRLAEVGGETIGVVLNKRRLYLPRVAYDWL